MSRWRWGAATAVLLLVAGAVGVWLPLLALGALVAIVTLALFLLDSEDRRHTQAATVPERRS